jgi:hypothetical protein
VEEAEASVVAAAQMELQTLAVVAAADLLVPMEVQVAKALLFYQYQLPTTQELIPEQ